MIILYTILLVLTLIVLIAWIKINPFLAFVITSVIGAVVLGIPADKVIASIQKGIGETLGALIIIVVLGAILGKLVAESGAAQQISTTLMRIFGPRYITWALAFTGFIVGLPLFYGIGFVLLTPLIFSVAQQYKLSTVYIGLPVLAALSVTHGFLPPHPAPTALVAQFKANFGLTILYGIVIAIPTMIFAGPVFSSRFKKLSTEPSTIFKSTTFDAEFLPKKSTSFITALLPVILLMLTSIFSYAFNFTGIFGSLIKFVGEPVVVMIVCVIVGTYTLGLKMGKSIKQVMHIYEESIKDISMVLLLIGGAGMLKQVFVDSNVDKEIAGYLQHLNAPPLLLGWGLAAILRICIGSSTVAGLMAAGIIFPIIQTNNVDPNLLVLAIGSGSMIFSHVNDSGFWMYKQYFNLNLKQTFTTFSVMETIVSVGGLIGVLILEQVIC